MPSSPRPSAREVGQFAAAWLALAVARLVILLLPFRAIVRTLHWGRGSGIADEQPGLELAHAVRRAAARVPWRAVCLDQGLAAHWLMRFRGIPSVFHYGINPAGRELSAHVWVSLGERILVGEDEAERHARVASFPAEAE